MLHLIIGGAGVGKSTRISELIARDVQDGRRAFLIIPEQQANLSERTMLPRLPERAGLTFTIAGFTKLYDRVAAKHGGITTRPPDRPLRLLLLWECLRQISPLLEEYRLPPESAPDGALTALMLQTMEELQRGSISPLALENAAKKLPDGTPLQKKLRDISLLYATFEARIACVTESDGSDRVAQLAALLQKHSFFADANIYIDSFTDFTAEEYAVLRELLRDAPNVTVALCCDRLHSQNPAFSDACDTADRLLRLANELGVPVKRTLLAENRRTTSPELRYLSEKMWDLSHQVDPAALPMPEARGDITVLRCADIYAESEAVALHILHLLHIGIPYGEMAIIVRDTEAYRGVLDAALERHGIPFYFSDKATLSEKPLSRLLLSALRAVSYQFPAQDVLTMVKTGLLSLPDADLDLFEQYVHTWGITGSAFVTEQWTRNPDGYTDSLSTRGAQILEAANRVREAIITPLLHLYTTLHADPSLPACCRALYAYMEEMRLARRCAEIAEQELSAGYLKEAGETLRVYDAVVDTLAQLSTALPDVKMTPGELCAALIMLFSQSEIASVPSLHDSVTVGGADTLRVENIAVSFVLGLCEGEFPRAVSDNGLLSDADKQQLLSFGIVLEDRSDRASSRELMYAWRAMSKPSKLLIVSTQSATIDGSSKAPSIAYTRLLYLLPYLKEQIISFDLSMSAPPPVEKSAPSEPSLPATHTPDPDGGTTDYISPPPTPDDLTPTAARSLLGDTLYLTQSRIQTFVQCPFRFYCTYLLDLRERKVAAIDYADSGTFFHFLLEKVLRACFDETGSFLLPTAEQIEPLADTFVNEYLCALLAATDTDAARSARILHLFSRLRALALVLLRDVLGELSHSRFLPIALELRIGGRTPNAPPPYEIRLDDGCRILLGGTVDRVDSYTRDGRLYLRVVDYKSGSRTFALDEVRRGINLQLLIYLFALCRTTAGKDTPLPAGATYISTKEKDGRVSAQRSGVILDDEDILHAINDTAAPTAATVCLTKDDFDALERDIRATLRAIGQDMWSGRAAKATDPENCRFCPLQEHCASRPQSNKK